MKIPFISFSQYSMRAEKWWYYKRKYLFGFIWTPFIMLTIRKDAWQKVTNKKNQH